MFSQRDTAAGAGSRAPAATAADRRRPRPRDAGNTGASVTFSMKVALVCALPKMGHVIAVVGPTAAGKSDLALGLALALGGEVVNADSMQLYAGMDIGTAKLTAVQRRYESVYPAVQIGVSVARAELDRRIAERTSLMWQAGFVAEVAGLDRAGLREGKTASRALGYAQVLRFLAGECSQDEALAQTIQATKRFARRQESWFRRDPRV